MNKPTITLDFDGVLHRYQTSYVKADVIPDRAVEGSIEWLLKAMNEVNIAILSCRSKEPGGITAMQCWLKKELVLWLKEGRTIKEQLRRQQLSGYEHEVELSYWAERIIHRIQWPVTKVASCVYIDDNAYRFNGIWPDLKSLLSMDSWVKES